MKDNQITEFEIREPEDNYKFNGKDSYVLETGKNIKNIIHCGDIHIRKEPSRHQEYLDVFKNKR